MIDDQHGHVEFSLINDIIIVATLTGSFNEFGARDYTHGIKQCVKALQDKHFAILVDNTHMLGGTPEAYQELEMYNQWLTQTNLVAKAIIVSQHITTELIKAHSPSVNLQNMKGFTDKKLALEWLTARLNEHTNTHE